MDSGGPGDVFHLPRPRSGRAGLRRRPFQTRGEDHVQPAPQDAAREPAPAAAAGLSVLHPPCLIADPPP